jgi:hypothetical protein
MDPTITAAWIGVGGALIGVGVGAGPPAGRAVRSLDKAAVQGRSRAAEGVGGGSAPSR